MLLLGYEMKILWRQMTAMASMEPFLLSVGDRNTMPELQMLFGLGHEQ